MQIEKINENKLEVIINMEDLNKKNISLQAFMSNSAKNNDLLFEILNLAKDKVGFNLKNCEIIVESFSIPSKSSFILLVTRIPKENELIKLAPIATPYKSLTLATSVLCSFNNFEDFCMFCKSINKKITIQSSLFLLDNTYYLYIKFKRIKDIKPVISSLLEFSNTFFFNKFLNENAKLLIKNCALEKSKKYFA